MRTIPDKYKSLINNPDIEYDVHVHFFHHECVPDKFLGIRLPYTHHFLSFLENTCEVFGWISEEESVTNAGLFLRLFKRDQATITSRLMSLYEDPNSRTKTAVCPLTMNMRHSISGKMPVSFRKQCSEIQEFAAAKPLLIPFLHLNPRDPDMEKDFNELMYSDTNPNGFWGVKYYPALGALPSHPLMMKIWKICEDQGIPVTTHCSSASVHTSDSKLTDIPRTEYDLGKYVEKKETKRFWTKEDYAKYFNDPDCWKVVVQAYPNLVLNFGHFGGLEARKGAWAHKITGLMYKHPNVYADISYALSDKTALQFLTNLSFDFPLVYQRLLYGTDYYMVVLEGKIGKIITNAQYHMLPSLLRNARTTNAKRFLFGIGA